MHSYDQRTGLWTGPGELRLQGYSGHGEGRNNPSLEHVQSVGPIPRGTWVIGEPVNSDQTGPYIMRLTPAANTNTFGRGSFEVHGDNAAHDASHGCIIIPGKPNRVLIWQACFAPNGPFVEVI